MTFLCLVLVAVLLSTHTFLFHYRVTHAAGCGAELGGHGDRTQPVQQRYPLSREAAGPAGSTAEPNVRLPHGERWADCLSATFIWVNAELGGRPDQPSLSGFADSDIGENYCD